MICTGPVFLLFFFKKKLSRRELPVPVKCCTHHDADSLFHQLKSFLVERKKVKLPGTILLI